MQEIDLDQPSQNTSAGADSANGGGESSGIKTVLDRVLAAVGMIANFQQQQMAKVAVKAATPSDSKSGHKPAQSAAANYKPWGRYEKKPVSANAEADAGSIARGIVTRAMDAKSRKITEHEERHSSVMREAGIIAKPVLTHQQGPDGRRYAVAGEVNADLSPVKGNPSATEAKAESIYRSAMSDSHRSAEDNEAGRRAMGAAQAARQQKSRAMGSMNSPDNADIGAGGGAMGSMNSPWNSGKCATKQGETQNQNPNAVKMRNPAAVAAVGGLLARGVTAIATGVKYARSAFSANKVLGPHPKRSGVKAARDYLFHQKVSIGKDKRGDDILVSRANALGKSFQDLTKSAKVLDVSFSGTTDRIRAFSADIAQQQSQRQINRIEQNMRQAQQLGKPLAEAERQRGRFEINTNQLIGDTQAWILPLWNQLSSQINSAIGILTAINKIFSDYVATPLSNALAYIFNPITEGWKKLEEAFREFAGLGKQQRKLDDNIQAFLGMELPAPGARPDVVPNAPGKIGLRGLAMPLGAMPPLPVLN